MEELTYKSKLATLRLLNDILQADNIIQESELDYLKKVAESFYLPEGYKKDLDCIVTLQALSVIRELTSEQKIFVARLLGEMIVIDKDINYNEVKMYHIFCESCDIHQDFYLEDYPDYSLSGPFINSEGR